jgi:hypothetical protein
MLFFIAILIHIMDTVKSICLANGRGAAKQGRRLATLPGLDATKIAMIQAPIRDIERNKLVVDMTGIRRKNRHPSAGDLIQFIQLRMQKSEWKFMEK